MKIKILLFATLRDQAGARELELEIPVNSTVDELKDILVARYPGMEPARSTIMTAINREYVAGEQIIPSGAEIALFPPVSGG